jgi:hypothetical protein
MLAERLKLLAAVSYKVFISALNLIATE